MERRPEKEGRCSPYRLRKTAIKPVFGQIKQACRFRQFPPRRLGKMRLEWTLGARFMNFG